MTKANLSGFVPSDMQANYFNWLSHGKGNAILVAVAGSGKSTTMVKGLDYMPLTANILMLAFNADAGRELAEKIAKHGQTGRDVSRVQGKTFHAWGFAAVRNCLRNCKLDAKKIRTIIQYELSPRDIQLYGRVCEKLVHFAKGEGIGAIIDDTMDAWNDIIAHHDLDLDSEDANWQTAIEIASWLMKRSIEVAEQNKVIDFDDQLYLPVLWGLKFPQQDFLIIDEAQDSSPIRIAIARMTLAPHGRLIAVGDPDQAINGFAGAGCDALEQIQKEFDCTSLPLTVSYRCPKIVEALTKPYSPPFTVHPNAPEGKLWEGIATEDALEILGNNDVVLCRNTAPLISLAYACIAKGRGVFVKGREIGQGLVALVTKQKAKGIDALIVKLDAYQERESAKFMAKGQEEKADAIADKIDCIRVLIESLPETGRTVPALIAKIEGMFDDEAKGRLTLSTIHKAKGLEWQNVAILRWDLCPSKYARQAWQKKQESNLQNVALTRTKFGLLFIDDKKEPEAKMK